MVIAAVKNTIYGHKLLEFLLLRADDPIVINNSTVLETAIEYGTLLIIKFLLRQPQNSYPSKFYKAAARNPHPGVIEFIFYKVNYIGDAILIAAARKLDRAINYLLV